MTNPAIAPTGSGPAGIASTENMYTSDWIGLVQGRSTTVTVWPGATGLVKATRKRRWL